jgi:hypothetical protein
VKEQREAPAVVPSILDSFRRLCRSSRPLCCSALVFSVVHLTQGPLPTSPRPNSEIFKDPSGAVSLLSPQGGSAVGEEGRGGEGPGGADVGSDPGDLEDRGLLNAAPVDELETIDLLAEEKAAFDIASSPYGQLIYDVAVRHAISPQLVAAMIRVESSFNPRAVSRKGACGLMQLLPSTARRFGVRRKKDLFDPKKNLEAGVRYVRWLTQRFGGDMEKILAAYNAGEGAVERFGGIPPYRETQRYVEKVFGLLHFTAGSATAGGVAAGK